MAQTKITSVQLSDSGVTPGPYTNADITVDAAGRITAAANGTGGAGTVTSVAVDGSAGRVTSSGGPVTGSGTITLDLDTTAVTPGAYTAADITVDAYGRITAAANGSGAPALTDTQVAYGSPANLITSTADFTYDDGTGTLAVGPTGFDALIQANVGQAIVVQGDTGARLSSNSKTFGIGPDGELLVTGNAGSPGQVLTSNGGATAATWETPSGGGGLEMNVYVMSNGNGSFDGSLVSNWSSVSQRDESPTVTWGNYDPYTGSFECLINGVYEIVVECQIAGNDGFGVWPGSDTAYGVDLAADSPALNATPQTKSHSRYSSDNYGLAAGPSPANLSGSIVSFTERYIVRSDPGGKVYPTVFAYSYSNSSPTTVCNMSISFMKISDYTPA